MLPFYVTISAHGMKLPIPVSAVGSQPGVEDNPIWSKMDWSRYYPGFPVIESETTVQF